MASLKATYPSQEDIPDGLEDYYKEMADGKFKLNLDGELRTQEDVDRAVKAMKKQTDKANDLEQKLSKYPDDFDPEKWEEVKGLDPESISTNGDIDTESEEFQQAVKQAAREKVEAAKEDLKNEHQQELNQKDQKINSLREAHKKDWIKRTLAERHGFTDQKALRHFIRDIEDGHIRGLKQNLESIDVIEENGSYKVVGGEFDDPDGAIEALEELAQADAAKDYKPAGNNRGGDASNEGSEESGTQKLKKEDGSLNLTVVSQMWKEDKEKAKRNMRAAGFDPDKYGF